MSARTPRIVLLHATQVAVEPVHSAMARLWPEAERVNLLDDGLTIDRAREGEALSESLIARFVALGVYAHQAGADGILVTCSAFGPAIERLAETVPIPVVKPNEAMFHEALSTGGRIAMLGTFGPAMPTMVQEFETLASQGRSTASLDTVVVEGAIDALRAGDAETHNRLLAERADALAGYDVIMLAHFSTSRAAGSVAAAVDVPVLSAPDAAVRRMRKLIEG